MKVPEQIPFFPPISVKPCWNASCKAGSYPAPAFQTHISQSPGRLPAHSPDGETVHKYDIPALRPSAPPFQPAHRPRGVPAPTNRTRQSGTGVSGIPRACSNQKKFRRILSGCRFQRIVLGKFTDDEAVSFSNEPRESQVAADDAFQECFIDVFRVCNKVRAR